MATSHSRNTSAADRRSMNAGGVPRAAPSRAKEYEKPYVRDDGSPVVSETYTNGFNNDGAHERPTKNPSSQDYEKRVERTTTTTRDKVIRTRSPVKESASAGNRGIPEKRKTSLQSPTARPKSKEVEPGLSSIWDVRDGRRLTCRSSTMDSYCYLDTSLFCATRC